MCKSAGEMEFQVNALSVQKGNWGEMGVKRVRGITAAWLRVGRGVGPSQDLGAFSSPQPP